MVRVLTGTITDDQARALAQLIATLRPRELRWDVAGTRAALSQARHLAPAADLCVAAIRCATNLENRTPAVIAMDGPHWHAAPPEPSRALSDVKCTQDGHERQSARTCTYCAADRKARPDDAPQPEPTDTLTAYDIGPALVRAAMRQHGIPVHHPDQDEEKDR